MGVRPMGRGKSAMWMAGLGRPPNGGHRGLAPAGGIVHAGCAPHFLYETSKRKCAAPGGKEKNVSVGRSAQAQTSCRRRGKVGNPARRSETETPGPWGNLQPGEVWDTRCADFRCRWPVVDESLRSGPMRASASTTARAARSEAGRAEREAGQMRSCTPTTSAPSATGRQSGKSQTSIACPKARPNRSRHWYADPRTRGGPLHRSAPGAFFSYTGRGAFSFWRNQKENGGRIAQLAPQLNPPGG